MVELTYNKNIKKQQNKKKQKKGEQKIMSKLTFDEAITQQQNSSEANQISFFSLKNDGDNALVRFMYDSVDEFEILSFHNAPVNGRDRKINCIRESNQPVSACPLCAKGSNTQTRIFIRLIEYVIDEQGNMVTSKPKVWERSISYAKQLSDYLNTYGPLKDSLFMITRHGASGSKDTKYQIAYMPEKMFAPENFPYKGDEFDNYSALGTVVINASLEDLDYYVNTGMFPQKEVEQQPTVQYQQPAAQYQQPQYSQSVYEPQPVQQPVRQAPWAQQQSNPSQQPTGMVPPKRTY